MKPHQIKEAMLIPDYSSIYFIGCIVSGKITIHSQQIRAINLAYALMASNSVKKNNQIAIIGGGISGITMAIAIAMIGCQIDIYEARQEVLDLQRKSDRFIHPNIFDWPAEGASSKKTELPFMNWKADNIELVIKRLYAIWQKYLTDFPNLKLKSGVNVTKVEEINDGNKTFTNLTFNNTLKKERVKGDETKGYDYVIYAGGFGIEKHERNEFLSYWEKDKHESDVEFIEKKVKIYGTGDGGLMDCVRISLKKFDYQNFTDEFAKNSLFNTLGKTIKEAEQNLQTKYENKKEISRYEREENISSELKTKYDQIFKPQFEEIASLLLKNYPQRKNVSVTLIGRTSMPYNLNSSILNKLVVYILLQKGIINYLKLKIDIDFRRYRRLKLYYDRIYNYFTKTIVIERLGPERPFIKLFDIKDEAMNNYREERMLLGVEKYWPKDFFDKENFALKKPGIRYNSR